ncbi:MAG: hypothetical protein ACI9LN_003799 [Saprospiraceae bacterium]
MNFQEFGFSMKPNAHYIIGESSNIEFDPRNPNISYTGVGTGIWKTEDDGVNFTQVYDFGSGNELGEIRIAWSDVKVIYAATFGSSDKVWRSADSGVSWSNVTPSAGGSVPYSISVSAIDANVLWAARTVSYTGQGTLNGNKVFKSTDGGSSWSNISGSALNGEYISNILHQKGTNGGVYIATRRTVYYKNDSMSDFVLFGNNLPASTFSTRMVDNYGAGKLYNGSNRSVYRVDFYEQSSPVAQIAVEDFNVLCSGDQIQFYDHSVALNGASYNWSFPGATPLFSSEKNPIVSYDNLGTFDVTLMVNDGNGTSTKTLADLTSVANDCNPETVLGMALTMDGSSGYATMAAPNFATNNFTISTWIKREGDQNDWAGLVFSRPGSGTSGLNMGTDNELRYHWQGSGSYNWNSGHVVPDGEWTHVALVVLHRRKRRFI